MSEPTITVTGNVVRDPENKRTTNGTPITTFTIAYSRRARNPQTNQWETVNTSYLDVTAFNTLAENAHQSLHKGTPVTVTGTLSQHTYTGKDNQKHSTWRLTADDIAVSIKNGIATLTRPQTNQGYNNDTTFGF